MQGLGTSTNSRNYVIEFRADIDAENFQLQLINQQEPETGRPKIPATVSEKLSFFRIFTNAVHRFDFMPAPTQYEVRMLINSLFQAIFQTLPMTYIHVFLASYVGHEHFFLSKMTPLLYGHNFAVIIAGTINLVSHADNLMRYCDHLENGLLHKSPWNTCTRINTTGAYLCRTFPEQAILKTLNSSIIVSGYLNVNDSGVRNTVQCPQIINSLDRLCETARAVYFGHHCIIYYYFVWIIAALCFRQLFDKRLWKVLNISHWAYNFLLLLIAFHMLYIYMEVKLPEHVVGAYTPRPLASKARKVEITLLAVTITSPAVVHIVIARSTKKINPIPDSALIVFSNTVYQIFKLWLLFAVKKYVERIYDYPFMSFYPSFYMYPIYWNNYYFKEMVANLYMATALLSELCTFILVFQCIVEHIVTEWPKVERWPASIIVAASGLLVGSVTNIEDHIVLNIFGTIVTTGFEAVGLVFLYPLFRLSDDIKFHTGKDVPSYTYWSMCSMPIFFGVKGYFIGVDYLSYHSSAIEMYEAYFQPLIPTLYKHEYNIWILFMTPYLLGLFYTIYCKIRDPGKDWKALFRPVRSWGPRDQVEKELRKQYDSRDYIPSQASRYLSQYLMSKSEITTYKLNICYERTGFQSDDNQNKYRVGNEKKDS